MEILTENSTIKHENLADYHFVDSYDVQYEIQRIPKSSIIDALRIFRLKQKHASNDVYLTLHNLDIFKTTERYITSIRLNNYNKYITSKVKTLCPIEYVIMKYCEHIDNWIFVVTRNCDSVKIVSGKKNIIVNSRIVFSCNIEQEITRTIKYVNRFINFQDITIITNIQNLSLKNKIEFLSNNNAFTLLAEYANKSRIYKCVFGKKQIQIPKCNLLFITLITVLSLIYTGIEYTNYVTEYDNYTTSQRLLKSHKNSFNGISKQEIIKFLNAIKLQSFSLSDIKQIHDYIEDGIIEKIILTNKKKTIIGTSFSHNDVKRVNGRSVKHNEMNKQRIEIEI